METESSRRDVEQREAVLRATSRQLQESLQRQMHEAAGREERLRDEVNEMRKRWQEAIVSRETLASELSSATAPLLRQISSLQESLRVKSENWQVIESSLSERALKAESAAELVSIQFSDSFIYSLVTSINLTLTPSLSFSFALTHHSLIHSFTHSHSPSLFLIRAQSLITHSLITHSFTHSLTLTLQLSFIYLFKF
jgi:hypothetical protein